MEKITDIKLARVHHGCGATIMLPYLYESDIFNNRIDCACGVKFFPKSAYFSSDLQDDLEVNSEVSDEPIRTN